MKAAYYSEFGPPSVYKVRDVPDPEIEDDEILIKVKASSVNSGDVKLRSFNLPLFYVVPMWFYAGFRKPKKNTLGSEFAGVAEKVGKNVKLFKKGERVYGGTDTTMGANAELLKIKASSTVFSMPAKMTFTEGAAMTFGFTTALHFLKKAGIRNGQNVLIYGASGAVGTAAIQIAKAKGAKITAVCSSKNVKLVKELGASSVIDYKKGDLANHIEEYDIVYEVVGKSNFPDNLNILKKDGVFILNSVFDWKWYIYGIINNLRGIKVIMGIASFKLKDMEEIKELYNEKKIKPVIGKTFPLEKISDAHKYVETGHKVGTAVIINK